jgi:hypothetical protein
MKHLCLAIAAVSFALTTNAQSGVKWAANGNAMSPGEFLGTTNDQPLVVKTNNTTRFTINANGDIQFNHLAGAGNQILSLDNTGKLIATPTSNSGSWQCSNNGYFVTTGNVGIGISPSPTVKLDVQGDAHVSNNLAIDGTTKFTGTSTFDSSPLLKNGLNFSSNKGIGFTEAAGGLPPIISIGNKPIVGVPSNTLPAGIPPCLAFNAAGMAGGVLMDVTGAMFLHDATNAHQLALGFDGANSRIESQYNTTVPNGNGLLINYGCGKNVAICTGVNGGGVYVGDFLSARKHVEIGDPIWGTNDTYNRALDIHVGNGKGIVFYKTNNASRILSSDTVNSPFVVYGGGNAHFSGNLQVGFQGSQSVMQDNTFLLNMNTNESPVNRNGIKFTTWNNDAKLIHLVNGNTNSGFTVFGNGKTIIGSKKVVGTHSDAMLQVHGKIASKALYVLKPDNWADYVFKTTENENLKVVERYIEKNKHLPDVPSEKEIMENGYDVNKVDAILLSKIERLYLHIIDQQKQIESLKAQLEKK